MSERLSVLLFNFRFRLGARILPRPESVKQQRRIIAYGDDRLSDLVLRWFAGEEGDGGFGCPDPFCLCRNPVFTGHEGADPGLEFADDPETGELLIRVKSSGDMNNE